MLRPKTKPLAAIRQPRQAYSSETAFANQCIYRAGLKPFSDKRLSEGPLQSWCRLCLIRRGCLLCLQFFFSCTRLANCLTNSDFCTWYGISFIIICCLPSFSFSIISTSPLTIIGPLPCE